MWRMSGRFLASLMYTSQYGGIRQCRAFHGALQAEYVLPVLTCRGSRAIQNLFQPILLPERPGSNEGVKACMNTDVARKQMII